MTGQSDRANIDGRRIYCCSASLFTRVVMVFHLLSSFVSFSASSTAASSSLKVRSNHISKQINSNYQLVPPNHIHQLVSRLFLGYNKEAVLDLPTVITMNILLLKVRNTIEKEGIFESVVALMIEWRDRRMMWDPAEYKNLTFLSLKPEQVWLPDIAMTNSADHLYAISRDERFTVRVSYNGLFKYVPTGTARTWCDLNLITFPFDVQTCSLEFESWSLDSSTMTFDGNSSLLVDSSFASTQFKLCDHTSKTYNHTYDFTGETFTRVKFEFTVKRKSTFYVINLIFPCATLSIIQLFVFLIPSTDTTADRIGFGTTNLLTLVVFQTIVTSEMPKSDDVTALSKYIIALIIMSAIGIFESVIVERIFERYLTKPPMLLLILLSRVPTILREEPMPRLLQHTSTLNEHHAAKQSMAIALEKCQSSNNIHAMRKMSRYVDEETGSFFGMPRVSTGNIQSFLEQETEQPIKLSIDDYNSTESNKFSKSAIKAAAKKLADKKRKSAAASAECAPRIEIDGASTTNEGDKEVSDKLLISAMWSEVAYKVDFLTLCFCATTAVATPCFMFIPLVHIEPGIC